MKILSISMLLLSFLSLVSCSPAAIDITLPEYSETLTNSPEVQPAAQAYLEAWKNKDYPAMYRSLTSVSQSAISETEFTNHYQSINDEMLLTDIGWEFLSVLVNETKAQVLYRITLTSGLVNSVTRDTGMTLSLENGEWRVQWDDAMILPELVGENYLYMDQEGYTPTRANIYDRYAHALVAQTDAVAVGLYPDQINPEQADQLLTELENLTGLSKEKIRSLYANVPQGSGWYIPVSEVPAERANEFTEALSGFSGLVLEPYRARFYSDNGVAPHVIGYTGMISEDEFAVLRQKGYKADERLGKSGLEKWGESYLSGKRGGELYVFNGQGQPVTRLAEAPASPGEAIYTTLDRDFQLAVQQAISGFRGAVVVLEKDTGRVVAMVSSPGFDPNAFEPSNFNSESLMNLLNDSSQPLLNRATQGLYPLGSVFKTITMAAGIESGRYTPESTYNCGYIFEELGPDSPLYDWTYQFYLQDGKTKPSGPLTLSQGLMRSCNPWFYHIGLDLFENGLKSFMPDLAAEFGLGRRTGITGIDEESGYVPEPRTEYDATNLGIGQGDLLVTPLQVANFIAALGNGGTLYRPQIVEAVLSPNGDPSFMFAPEPVGKLPVKPETLKAIQDAMVGVVRSTRPVGTAWHQFTGLDINVAGKTGTATSGSGAPHAWFAGYTFEDRPDRPDIAVAVVLENAGEGSAYAAPVFRRIIELYFSGQPQKLYEWESSFGVNRTPTQQP